MEVGWDPVLVTLRFWINGGQLGPRVGHVTFLDQRRSVGLVFQGGFMVFHGFWLVSMVLQGGFMVFGWFTWFFKVPGWFFMVFLQNVPAPNCILARRSSLGPPPGGRHRT